MSVCCGFCHLRVTRKEDGIMVVKRFKRPDKKEIEMLGLRSGEKKLEEYHVECYKKIIGG